jgi:hypothetical protein
MFCGQRVRESAKTVARDIERARRRQMEEGLHGI